MSYGIAESDAKALIRNVRNAMGREIVHLIDENVKVVDALGMGSMLDDALLDDLRRLRDELHRLRGSRSPDQPSWGTLSAGASSTESGEAFYEQSYTMLRDALEEHLGEFIRDGEEAEEYLYIRAIEEVGARLRSDPGEQTAPAAPSSTADQTVAEIHRVVTERFAHRTGDPLWDAVFALVAHVPARAASSTEMGEAQASETLTRFVLLAQDRAFAICRGDDPDNDEAYLEAYDEIVRLMSRSSSITAADPGEQSEPRAFCGSVMRDTTPAGLFVCRLESGHSDPHRAALPDGDGDVMWTDAGASSSGADAEAAAAWGRHE